MIVKVEPAILDAVGADAIPLFFEPEKWKIYEFIKGYPLEIPENTRIEKKDNGEKILYSSSGQPSTILIIS